MLCVSCLAVAPGVLCEACLRSLRPGRERVLPGGLRVAAAFEHTGVPRRLVHGLKYDGILGLAAVLAGPMAACLPDGRCLVPVPRAVLRRVRYGVDQGRSLARELYRATGVPVIDALRPPFHSTRHAGTGRDGRSPPVFRLRRPVTGVILVDDVVTTGSTLLAAEAVLGGGAVVGAVTATAALPGRGRVPQRAGEPQDGEPRVR